MSASACARSVPGLTSAIAPMVLKRYAQRPWTFRFFPVISRDDHGKWQATYGFLFAVINTHDAISLGYSRYWQRQFIFNLKHVSFSSCRWVRLPALAASY